LVHVVVKWVIAGCLVTAILGCQRDQGDTAVTCGEADSPATYRVKGKALVGDVDADGTGDRVTLRVDGKRPARCRYVVVVQLAEGRTAVATLTPLAWPGTDPQLLLLAEIDGRPGLEPVLHMTSRAAVYRPGVLFTLNRGKLLRLRLERVPVPELFPFYDEFPAGVDCTGPPGRIVVTRGRIADGGDRFWDVTRSFYRSAGVRFVFVRDERFLVDVGPDAPRRWPEIRGDPFLRCAGRVS
jgi:hypothetical protein